MLMSRYFTLNKQSYFLILQIVRFLTNGLCMRWVNYNCIFILILSSGCSQNNDRRNEEEIRIPNSAEIDQTDTSNLNSIHGNLRLDQIPTTPNNVVLTGLSQHRLVTFYRQWLDEKGKDGYFRKSYYDGYESERESHFMPGIDLIYGFNLLNVAHYDLKLETLNFLFTQPVLIKSLYYPALVPDSVDDKPINRDYYLISVYDADTNLDTLINKNDLRRFYYFNASCTEKIQLIPPDYSVIRSQYDRPNDLMYIFARHDANHDGGVEKKEPLHIFWLDLKLPAKAKRLY